jgi:hypothetical protein
LLKIELHIVRCSTTWAIPSTFRSLPANGLWDRKTPEPAKNPFHGCHESSKNSSTSENLVCQNMNYTTFNANDAGYRFHMLISSNKPSIEPNNGWNFSKFLKYLLWARNMSQRLSGRRNYISISANATASA